MKAALLASLFVSVVYGNTALAIAGQSQECLVPPNRVLKSEDKKSLLFKLTAQEYDFVLKSISAEKNIIFRDVGVFIPDADQPRSFYGIVSGKVGDVEAQLWFYDENGAKE